MGTKDTQLIFRLSATLPSGEQIKDQICTTHTVLNIFIIGATVHSLERYW